MVEATVGITTVQTTDTYRESWCVKTMRFIKVTQRPFYDMCFFKLFAWKKCIQFVSIRNRFQTIFGLCNKSKVNTRRRETKRLRYFRKSNIFYENSVLFVAMDFDRRSSQL